MNTIEKIRAEVEGWMREYAEDSQFELGERNGYKRLLSFLSNLEKEEKQINVWSNTPIKAKVKETGKYIMGFTDGKGHLHIPVDHNSFLQYNIDELEFDTLQEQPVDWQKIAKAHAKDQPLGQDNNGNLVYLQEQPVCEDVEKEEKPIIPDGLDEEVHSFFDECIEVYEVPLYGKVKENVITADCYEITARHFAKWQKEQMMKEAVDSGMTVGDINRKLWYVPEDFKVVFFKEGDKVKLIIVKEE